MTAVIETSTVPAEDTEVEEGSTLIFLILIIAILALFIICLTIFFVMKRRKASFEDKEISSAAKKPVKFEVKEITVSVNIGDEIDPNPDIDIFAAADNKEAIQRQYDLNGKNGPDLANGMME